MVTHEDYTDDQIVAGLTETAKTVTRLMLSLLALGLFSLLAIGQPDAYLLYPAATVSVPSVGATSAKALLIVGPLLLIGVRIYLQVYVQHWHHLDEIANDRAVKRAIVISPMRHPVLRRLSEAVLYLLVPAILAAFTWKAMAIPKELGYGLLILTVFVTLVHLSQAWRREWSVRLVLCTYITAGIGVIGGAMFLERFQRPLDLHYADLSKTDLSFSDLRDANLQHANLKDADLSFSDLRDANLRRANLKGSEQIGTNLSGVALNGADVSGAELSGANLNGANLSGASLIGAGLFGAKLTGADFFGANLSKTGLFGANLSGANLTAADLSGADLSGANLQMANLSGANLSRAGLSGANLAGANLSGASLIAADVRLGRLLFNKQLRQATDLPQELLDPACGDIATVLPAGLTINNCLRE